MHHATNPKQQAPHPPSAHAELKTLSREGHTPPTIEHTTTNTFQKFLFLLLCFCFRLWFYGWEGIRGKRNEQGIELCYLKI
ncbi:hypothetical protein Patl1_05648 [Pistacia atlantica]|uniref:Uncharacterized protein n=1 Tax=Pistacia atlantica TaxID=434234 RepID=A0ACC1BRQ2_9ROSI|nr:hypothetical protein Patl1_05648 [Pistacia atlantica]